MASSEPLATGSAARSAQATPRMCSAVIHGAFAAGANCVLQGRAPVSVEASLPPLGQRVITATQRLSLEDGLSVVYLAAS